MSIKIHHGPPGSYKTSGAVMDDFLPAARAGRVCITNVRGLSDENKIREKLGCPLSFELIYLPTTDCDEAVDNRFKLATFWHWAPDGAFLLIDEVNTIWPVDLPVSQLAQFNFSNSYAAGGTSKRPERIQQAFEMHRHFNWDLVLTTPNIDKVHKVIRLCSEGAFKHKNLALVGLRGRYMEAMHMAEDSGRSSSDILSLRSRKIDSVIWGLYESTTTGTVTDTSAGFNLFTDPRVIGLLGLLTVIGFFLFSFGHFGLLSDKKIPTVASSMSKPATAPVSSLSPLPSSASVSSASPQSLPASSATPLLARSVSPDVSPSRDASLVSPGERDSFPRINSASSHPFEDFSFYFVGSFKRGAKRDLFFRLASDARGTFFVKSSDLERIEYRFTYLTDCMTIVYYRAVRFFALCDPSPSGSHVASVDASVSSSPGSAVKSAIPAFSVGPSSGSSAAVADVRHSRPLAD